MKKLIQTKFVKYAEDGVTMVERGNCFPTCIACLMDLRIDQVPNIEELYHLEPDVLWAEVLHTWLERKGYRWMSGNKSDYDHFEGYYLVSGKSPRGNFNHIVIYKDGKLFHDPHPEGTGLLTEDNFEHLEKIN